MQLLSVEKSRLLADKNGWSVSYAEGYVEGEAYRRGGKALSTYALVGIDEYALGFRAGFFERQTPAFGRIGKGVAADRDRQKVHVSNVAVSATPTESLQNVVQLG